MRQIDIEAVLPLVSKPSRYIDHEINACRKEVGEVRFCFAFPDAYEVGISHLGLKILYSIVNGLSYARADRTYLPWVDMIQQMRQRSIPLFAWESRNAVRSFDVLGITLQSELTFTNVLELLDLAQVNVYSRARGSDEPIVMAGGPCASNPLPLAPFIDVFFIGEAEEAIVEIAEICREHTSREQRLKAMAALPGCYIPQIHGIQPEESVQIRKYISFASGENTHKPQLLPWQLATHNRFVAEIMRGCTRGCRFCHAGYFYRPIRERSPEDILDDILNEINQSGWDEVGLVSLSSSDYTCIRPLMKAILSRINTDKTHVSLPSLRVDSLDDGLIKLMQKLGREGLTIAPEAGSQRLRDVINKNLSHEDIIEGVNTAIRLGWQKIKLYFMLGLPTETEEDIDELIRLIQEIDSISNKKLQINVTLSPFVPKPFTPFQWSSMVPGDVLLSRSQRIKNTFSKKRFIKIKYHTIENSILEALITRADLGFAAVIHRAWELGAIYDAWNECFDFRLWQQALDELGYDVPQALNGFGINTDLPWDFINIGVTKEFLQEEYLKAEKKETTMDCRLECQNCGVCGGEIGMDFQAPHEVKQEASATDQAIWQSSGSPLPETRYRVFYRKEGILRFISHLDWMRMLFRLISMLKLDVVYTQGFNPHPKVSLSPPLPVGVEGTCEFFDISFRNSISPKQIIAAFDLFGIPDFHVYEAIPAALCSDIPSHELIRIDVSSLPDLDIDTLIQEFFQMREFIFTKTKKDKVKTYDLRMIIDELTYDGTFFMIRKSLQSPALYDILEKLLQVDREKLYNLQASRVSLISESQD